MQYMIHAAPPRMWYVEKYLIPSMRAQGIEDVEVWNDTDGNGCLVSCMEAFRACGDRPGGTWHLQDDVIISPDFAARTAEHDDGLVQGFVNAEWGPFIQQAGLVPMLFMWWSFQCQRIPNDIAGECAEWFYNKAQYDPKYSQFMVKRNGDDSLFREFMKERHEDMRVLNLKPNIVDHIDYLIGGTLANKARPPQLHRSAFWEHEDLVDELAKQLEMITSA